MKAGAGRGLNRLKTKEVVCKRQIMRLRGLITRADGGFLGKIYPPPCWFGKSAPSSSSPSGMGSMHPLRFTHPLLQYRRRRRDGHAKNKRNFPPDDPATSSSHRFSAHIPFLTPPTSRSDSPRSRTRARTRVKATTLQMILDNYSVHFQRCSVCSTVQAYGLSLLRRTVYAALPRPAGPLGGPRRAHDGAASRAAREHSGRVSVRGSHATLSSYETG